MPTSKSFKFEWARHVAAFNAEAERRIEASLKPLVDQIEKLLRK